MNQSFFGWSDFETQYKNIHPQILIEELYRDDDGTQPLEFEIWCFNGVPKLFQEIKKDSKKIRLVSSFDENLNSLDLKFIIDDTIVNKKYSNILLKAIDLSKILSKDFLFVRVDWMVHNDKLYFSEMTFTPYSGFISFPEEYKDWQLKLGKMLELKGN